MELISYWNLNLDNLEGAIDPERGAYVNAPDVWSAQQELYEALGTNQLIWCNTRQEGEDDTRWDRAYKHYFEVKPEDSCIEAVIQDQTWLDFAHWSPFPSVHQDSMKSFKEAVDLLNKRSELIDSKIYPQRPPEMWEGLMLDNEQMELNPNSVQVLLRWPECKAYITNVVENPNRWVPSQ